MKFLLRNRWRCRCYSSFCRARFRVLGRPSPARDRLLSCRGSRLRCCRSSFASSRTPGRCTLTRRSRLPPRAARRRRDHSETLWAGRWWWWPQSSGVGRWNLREKGGKNINHRVTRTIPVLQAYTGHYRAHSNCIGTYHRSKIPNRPNLRNMATKFDTSTVRVLYLRSTSAINCNCAIDVPVLISLVITGTVRATHVQGTQRCRYR